MPELADLFREAFLPSIPVEDDHRSAHLDANKTNASVAADEPEIESQIPLAYSSAQPMKAAFHFDSVDDFGEWQILVSSRADRDLRDAKRRDKKLFAIILKKIK